MGNLFENPSSLEDNKVVVHPPETGKRYDGLIKSPRGNEVFPDGVGGIISPGRLETRQTRSEMGRSD